MENNQVSEWSMKKANDILGEAQVSLMGFDIKHMLREKIEEELDLIKSQADELAQALADYGDHDKDCICSQQQAGRPTDDGGYEMLFGYGKEARWVREVPPCTCGFTKALESYRKG